MNFIELLIVLTFVNLFFWLVGYFLIRSLSKGGTKDETQG